MKNKPHPLDDIDISDIVRVNQAGEYGAKRIYEGQIKYVSEDIKSIIYSMYESEIKHLEYFNNFIKNSTTRSTIMLPVWHIFSYILGVGTSFNKDIAFLCTDAVESVISDHYLEQIKKLERLLFIPSLDPLTKSMLIELKENITKFRLEEIEHQNIAIDLQKNRNFILFTLIQLICKSAIKISKVI